MIEPQTCNLSVIRAPLYLDSWNDVWQ